MKKSPRLLPDEPDPLMNQGDADAVVSGVFGEGFAAAEALVKDGLLGGGEEGAELLQGSFPDDALGSMSQREGSHSTGTSSEDRSEPPLLWAASITRRMAFSSLRRKAMTSWLTSLDSPVALTLIQYRVPDLPPVVHRS